MHSVWEKVKVKGAHLKNAIHSHVIIPVVKANEVYMIDANFAIGAMWAETWLHTIWLEELHRKSVDKYTILHSSLGYKA